MFDPALALVLFAVFTGLAVLVMWPEMGSLCALEPDGGHEREGAA